MATLVPCLVQLRGEFDALYPDRDRTTDGWIGDEDHQNSDSDHNPAGDGQVHAIDVDRDLGDGGSMQAYVDHVVARCRSGSERRLTYVIFDRHIYSASHGWSKRAYSGSSDHTQHAHFSASEKSEHENDRASWRLEEVPVALTEADKKWFIAEIDKRVGDVVRRREANGALVGGDNPNMTLASAAEYTDWYANQARTDIVEKVLPALGRIEACLAEQP